MNENKPQKHDFSFWKTIFSFAKGNEKRFTAIIALSVIAGIMVAIQPLIIKYIVDDGISNVAATDNERLTIAAFFCCMFVLVSAVRVGVWAVAYKLALKSLENFVFKVRSEYFYHVEHLCMRFHEKISAGELYNGLMGSPLNNIKMYLQQVILAIPYQSVSFVISICALLYYDWLLTVVLVAVAGVMVILNKFAGKKMRRMSSEYIEKEAETSKYITDVIHGMDAVKIYSIENNIYKTFNNYVAMMRDEGIRLNYSQYLEQTKPEFVTFAGTAVIYFVGAFSCIYRGVSAGTLFAFISSMNIILTTLTSWLNINLQKQSAYSGLEKVMNIINTKTSTPENEKNHNIHMEKTEAQKRNNVCVEFKNVKFGYTEDLIYNNFSCSIKYNESVGLVGSSGSGKSTFTKLVMRLYDVQDGEIKIHGKNIKDFKLHDLRRSFGVVPQNPFIFQGTIMDNIRIARPDCKNTDIIHAMEIAHVHEFVNKLENGWNTIIGDGGLNLSGGQIQRIAIARAVLGNPDILIFDEATSALDNVSERHIQQAMEELMKEHTVIIVAHRLTTIKNVDRIMVFDKGEVVEEGSFDELAKIENGEFAKLLNN